MFNLQPPRHISTLLNSRRIAVSQQTTFMEWSGRAPAPPASKAGVGD